MKTGQLQGTINNLWQVVYDSGELAAAVASITISNLLGNTDEEYKLICRFVDDDTTGGYYLRFNNDSGSNYGYQYIKGEDTTPSAVRDTSEAQIDLGYTNTDGNICFSQHLIYSKSGYVRTVLSQSAEDIITTTITSLKNTHQSWNNTTDEITSMVIGALNDKMNIGSRIILLKKIKLTSGIKTGDLNIQGKIINTWQKVYETTLFEAATSVTISGLNGDVDVIYRLRCRFVNDYNGGTAYGIRPNNDTDSNYGLQRLSGSDTSLSAARSVAFAYKYIGYNSAQNEICFTDILIFAKSGYLRPSLATIGMAISGTTVIQFDLRGNVWTNTANNITSLVILAAQASGLGIGTYICLEKLVLS